MKSEYLIVDRSTRHFQRIAFSTGGQTLVFCIAISFVIVALSSYNLFNGFGEDPDSLRILLSAKKSSLLNEMIPSRSWGFPLYEIIAYHLITGFRDGILLVKIFSLFCSVVSALLLFRILVRLNLRKAYAFLMTVAYSCHPLVIIASNSVLETGLSILTLVLIIYFVQSLLLTAEAGGKGPSLYNLIIYSLLFGVSVLVRPDNLFYFPVLFICLYFCYPGWHSFSNCIIPLLVVFATGIAPYFFLGYPIFHYLPSFYGNYLLYPVKNILAIFGIPLTVALIAASFICLKRTGGSFFIKSVRGLINNDVFISFLLVFVFFILLRTIFKADELEYSLILWVVFILLFGKFFHSFFNIIGVGVTTGTLILCFLTFLPNLTEIYFFDENGNDFRVEVGITQGVFVQERDRRNYYHTLYKDGHEMIKRAAINLMKKNENYTTYLVYKDCANCIVFMQKKEIPLYKQRGGEGTDLSHNRIVISPRFNITRGWRNFIIHKKLPELGVEELVIN